MSISFVAFTVWGVAGDRIGFRGGDGDGDVGLRFLNGSEVVEGCVGCAGEGDMWSLSESERITRRC